MRGGDAGLDADLNELDNRKRYERKGDDNMAGYLFVHFTGEEKNGEQVYFSISRDGLYWSDLNEGEPVLYSRIGELGVRDPFLVRDERKNKYYLIATDARIEAGKGWDEAQNHGSRSLIAWESNDLVHWSEERSCRVGIDEAGCVWAPEAVYDPVKEAFFVFWASKVSMPGEEEGKFRIYGSYTEDFREFSKPFLYLEKERDVIDTTIVWSGGEYYRFTKDETTSRIILEAGDRLDGAFREIHSETLESLTGVEGPECYQLPDGETWCVIVDQFQAGKGYLPLLTKSLECGTFEMLDESAFDMGRNKKRHGGVLKLTDEEYERLRRAYGPQNPVIGGLYADPDIAVFDGTYYIYPTTDGFKDWSGTEFSVFSSKDNQCFKKAAKIFDVVTEVPWAVGSAWAPCIAGKNGRYYFYFCARRADGTSCIGAAVSDSPTGKFLPEPEPFITPELMETLGVRLSQTIDPSVYVEDDKAYMLFGNGRPVIGELECDMVHLKLNTVKNIEGAYEFREAITVLKHGGRYHFTWSCDDTGSENYHVNYGISDYVSGPVEYQYPILEKTDGTLGPGHHSIVKEPDRDKYIIAYHRFATPLKRYPEGKGFHREVCTAALEFGGDGKMIPVKIKD